MVRSKGVFVLLLVVIFMGLAFGIGENEMKFPTSSGSYNTLSGIPVFKGSVGSDGFYSSYGVKVDGNGNYYAIETSRCNGASCFPSMDSTKYSPSNAGELGEFFYDDGSGNLKLASEVGGGLGEVGEGETCKGEGCCDESTKTALDGKPDSKEAFDGSPNTGFTKVGEGGKTDEEKKPLEEEHKMTKEEFDTAKTALGEDGKDGDEAKHLRCRMENVFTGDNGKIDDESFGRAMDLLKAMDDKKIKEVFDGLSKDARKNFIEKYGSGLKGGVKVTFTPGEEAGELKKGDGGEFIFTLKGGSPVDFNDIKKFDGKKGNGLDSRGKHYAGIDISLERVDIKTGGGVPEVSWNFDLGMYGKSSVRIKGEKGVFDLGGKKLKVGEEVYSSILMGGISSVEIDGKLHLKGVVDRQYADSQSNFPIWLDKNGKEVSIYQEKTNGVPLGTSGATYLDNNGNGYLKGKDNVWRKLVDTVVKSGGIEDGLSNGFVYGKGEAEVFTPEAMTAVFMGKKAIADIEGNYVSVYPDGVGGRMSVDVNSQNGITYVSQLGGVEMKNINLGGKAVYRDGNSLFSTVGGEGFSESDKQNGIYYRKLSVGGTDYLAGGFERLQKEGESNAFRLSIGSEGGTIEVIDAKNEVVVKRDSIETTVKENPPRVEIPTVTNPPVSSGVDLSKATITRIQGGVDTAQVSKLIDSMNVKEKYPEPFISGKSFNIVFSLPQSTCSQCPSERAGWYPNGMSMSGGPTLVVKASGWSQYNLNGNYVVSGTPAIVKVNP